MQLKIDFCSIVPARQYQYQPVGPLYEGAWKSRTL
jgi:hypothetical protein